MRVTRTARRKRRSPRLRAREGVQIATVATDVPRCVSCGEPLVRLPRFLTSPKGAERGFQCQRCFYAHTAPMPTGREMIASERTRWLTDMLAEPGRSSPAPRDREED